jgi:predicted nucleic acid-binding protein
LIVIDASVALAWCFEDESAPSTDAIAETVRRIGGCVPALWRLEVANVLLMAVRRKRIVVETSRSMLLDLERFPLEIDASTNDVAWSETLTLADRHNLTVYDAAYLELAMRRALPLATLDTRLADAARAEGLAVLP